MKNIFIKLISLILFSSLIASCSKGFEVKELTKTSTSWDNNKIYYPKYNAELTAIHLTLLPKTELPFHCHPTLSFAYVESGAIEVEKMNGEKKIFNKGDIITETAKTWHRGRNLSSITKTKLVVFYIGHKGVNNTILYQENTKNKCK